MRKNFTVVIVQIGPILKNLMLMIISFSFDIGELRWNQIEIQINFALECLTGETCAKPQLLGQNSHLDAKVFLKLHSDIHTETKRVENWTMQIGR